MQGDRHGEKSWLAPNQAVSIAGIRLMGGFYFGDHLQHDHSTLVGQDWSVVGHPFPVPLSGELIHEAPYLLRPQDVQLTPTDSKKPKSTHWKKAMLWSSSHRNEWVHFLASDRRQSAPHPIQLLYLYGLERRIRHCLPSWSELKTLSGSEVRWFVTELTYFAENESNAVSVRLTACRVLALVYGSIPNLKRWRDFPVEFEDPKYWFLQGELSRVNGVTELIIGPKCAYLSGLTIYVRTNNQVYSRLNSLLKRLFALYFVKCCPDGIRMSLSRVLTPLSATGGGIPMLMQPGLLDRTPVSIPGGYTVAASELVKKILRQCIDALTPLARRYANGAPKYLDFSYYLPSELRTIVIDHSKVSDKLRFNGNGHRWMSRSALAQWTKLQLDHGTHWRIKGLKFLGDAWPEVGLDVFGVNDAVTLTPPGDSILLLSVPHDKKPMLKRVTLVYALCVKTKPTQVWLPSLAEWVKSTLPELWRFGISEIFSNGTFNFQSQRIFEKCSRSEREDTGRMLMQVAGNSPLSKKIQHGLDKVLGGGEPDWPGIVTWQVDSKDNVVPVHLNKPVMPPTLNHDKVASLSKETQSVQGILSELFDGENGFSTPPDTKKDAQDINTDSPLSSLEPRVLSWLVEVIDDTESAKSLLVNHDLAEQYVIETLNEWAYPIWEDWIIDAKFCLDVEAQEEIQLWIQDMNSGDDS
ncbi:tellurite resistance TerB C-terminal domain-containing protein [Vibrio splendidus]